MQRVLLNASELLIPTPYTLHPNLNRLLLLQKALLNAGELGLALGALALDPLFTLSPRRHAPQALLQNVAQDCTVKDGRTV